MQPSDNMDGQFVTRKEFTTAVEGIRHAIETLSNKISEKTAPNFGTFWAASGVVLALIVSLCGGLFYHFNERIHIQDVSREETFRQLNTRIERLENNADEVLKDEAKRYRDSLQPTKESK